MFCDWNIERYVRKNFYEELNALNPIERFTKKFNVETELLRLDIKPADEIIGWFCFDKKCDEEVVFADEIQDKATEDVINAPEVFKSRTGVDRGHTLVDYESILKNGLVFYENKIVGELAKYPRDEYLLSMKAAIEAVRNLTNRVAGMIDGMISSGDESEKPRLTELKNMIKKVPYYPAESFREAVQSVWIIHFLTPLAENAWYSISLGRFDKYVYPYYKKSSENGMTREEAKRILHNFYMLLNSYADGACLLNVGAKYNELSELIIECQKEFAMPAPILGARVDETTPREIWDMLIDEKLFSMGQPTFYGEKSCVSALVEKGLPEDEARQFSNNSCMGISIAGEEFDSMWGCVLSVSAVLETAMNRGRMLQSDEVLVPDIEEPKNIDELFENFGTCVGRLLVTCVKSYEKRAEVSEKTLPDPFISLLTPDCIEKRCDRISGVKYHNVTFECMGMVNVGDGICAIDRLVFKDKKYTIAEMNKAVKNNFVGFEKIRSDVMKCPKFGENSAADDYTVRIAEILQKAIRSFSHDNIYYSPSLHTIDLNVGYGAAYGAGYDGRRAGEPFAKNAGASNEARQADPTSMILSCSKLPQRKFFGGQPIDVNFGIDTVKNHKKEIRTLIDVYLGRGGLQFQVNSVSSKLLREAMENPEKYPNLVVRIGGYSTYFRNISRESQREFIERFEKEGR